ncbi:MAG: inorganic phosphate transporter, partial [Acidobacteriota bacterium]
MSFALFLLILVAYVAYANGANDNFKGVATLLGSGTTSYRGALLYGTAATFAGSLAALALSRGLVATFSGAGLVPDALVGSPGFVAVVAAGAGTTVLLATWLSLPVSTTHALTGALVGAGLVLAGRDLQLGALGSHFVLPLVASPIMAVALTAGLYPLLRRARLRMGVERTTCVCVGETWVPATTLASGEATGSCAMDIGVCEERYQGTVMSVDAQQALNGAHFFSAGA